MATETVTPETATETPATPRIELTDKAREMFRQFLDAEDRDDAAIRLAIDGRTAGGFHYALDVVGEDEAPGHLELDLGGVPMLVEPGSAEHLDGVTIDFLKRGLESGFHFDNPNSPWKSPAARAVQEVLDHQINPAVASHGGHVTLLDVEGDTAYVSFGGGCQGCGMADVTLKQGVETTIKEAVPEIHRVLDTTDHAAGENPYYRGGGDSPFP